MSILKLICLLSPFILLIVSSCKDDTVNSSNNYNLVTDISGKIYNLPDSANAIKGIVQLDFENFITDSCIADSSDLMFLTLNPVPSKFLFDIDGFFTRDTMNMIISDHNARLNNIVIGAYYDSTGYFAGEIYKDNHLLYKADSVGFFRVLYLFCDRELAVGGYDISVYNGDSSKLKYNLNLGAGWNVVTFRNNISRTNYSEHELFNGELQGASWYCYRNN